MKDSVTPREVREAAARIASEIRRTPLIYAGSLSEEMGIDVYLKLENHQRTGAFKLRGALNCVLSLSEEERQRGLVAASSGNHALGLSLAGKITGAPVTVVMPETAPASKIDGCRKWSAQVVLEGQNYDGALARAEELAQERGLTYVQSFDNAMIMAGQGTVALEIAEDLPEVRHIVAPVGGGGLLSGVISYIKHPQGPGPIRVTGVQSQGAPAMVEAVRRGEWLSLDKIRTLADGIAVGRPGRLSYQVISQGVDEMVAVEDRLILLAMGKILLQEHTLAEPAAAAPVAALINGLIHHPGDGPLVCIVTGGNTNSEMICRALGTPIRGRKSGPH